MSEMHRYLKQMKRNAEEAFALAAVTDVEGSSYRKKGAKMLFAANGKETGLVSGGCVEEDLSYAAASVLASGKARKLSYDLRSEDDLGWGAGAGCNGCIHVYLQRFCWKEDRAELAPVLAALDSSNEVIALTQVGEGSAYYLESGERLSGNIPLTKEHLKLYRGMLQSGETTAFIDKEQQLLMERYEPQETLYIFGAGRDAEPLVHQAARLHFAVKVIDPREARCNAAYFPDAEELICSHPGAFFQSTKLKPKSYVLIMTHSFERDQRILQEITRQAETFSYIGILGPLRRTRRLLGTAAVPAWLHAPVGLSISAEGAEEISISITAELIQVRRSRQQAAAERVVM